MKNAKHTPGPWTIFDDSDGEVLTIQPMSAQLVVCDPDDVSTNRANAYLIAAAPELLEALKRVLQNMPKDLSLDGLQLESDLKSLIAKATGGK